MEWNSDTGKILFIHLTINQTRTHVCMHAHMHMSYMKDTLKETLPAQGFSCVNPININGNCSPKSPCISLKYTY